MGVQRNSRGGGTTKGRGANIHKNEVFVKSLQNVQRGEGQKPLPPSVRPCMAGIGSFRSRQMTEDSAAAAGGRKET